MFRKIKFIVYAGRGLIKYFFAHEHAIDDESGGKLSLRKDETFFLSAQIYWMF